MHDGFNSHAPQEVYDAFLSYNSKDSSAVEDLAHRLAGQRLRVFFDAWDLVRGDEYQQALERALRMSRSTVVLWGPSGAGPWQTTEVRLAVSNGVKDPDARVIVVLLDGSPEPTSELMSGFLSLRSRVDMRDTHRVDDAFGQLCAGILGLAPGRPKRMPHWLKTLDLPEIVEPTGIDVDGGLVFVADHTNGQLLKIREGRAVDVFEGLSRPHHVAAHDGSIVVCDTFNDRLVCLDDQLQELCSYSRAGPRPLQRPRGVCWGADGRLFLVNTERHEVIRLDVTRAGKLTAPRAAHFPASLTQPCGVSTRPDAVLVADTFAHQICVLDQDLQPVLSFGEFGNAAGGFGYPVGLACWRDSVVVADEYNERLQLWKLSRNRGRWSAACVSPDLCGEWLGSPFGVAFTPFDGDLWVTDRRHGTVLRIDFEEMLNNVGDQA